MRSRLLAASIAATIIAASPQGPVRALQTPVTSPPREGRIAIGGALLYSRDIGRGQVLIVLHGGPDFDTNYLLPDLDRLADGYRLLYYDQRGRGRSADGVRPEDVTMATDVEDLDKVRQHFQSQSTALLAHSWGAVLALEYALGHSEHVSHLILMNPAPASTTDLRVFRKSYLERLGADMDRQRAITASAAYQAGDPEAVAARYRLHFKFALARPGDYERLMATMKAAFVRQGNDGIVKARAVEDRLMRDTWQVDSYDLLPRLRTLKIPTLVIAGDHDFIPVEIAAHVAAAIPDARLVTLENCGHFAYLECPTDLRTAVDQFFRQKASAIAKRRH